MKTAAIIVKNVSATWQGTAVLQDVSFELKEGEHLLITGASGSGKSTLAKSVTGKLFHAGTVEFFGSKKPLRPSVVFVEQHYHFKNLSNVSNFYYQQRFNSFDADDASTVQLELESTQASPEKISLLLKQFDLAYRASSPLLHLSSGEHKRFQLVKALLQSPQYIVFDEPFTGLDIQTRETLQTTINALAANGTCCILICKPADAPCCITHVLELEHGKAVQFLRIEHFLPATEKKVTEQLPTAIAFEPLAVNYTEAVVFKNVSVAYGSKQILSNINWQVKHGDKWLLKGRNGAGKSTLLSLITGDNPLAYANDIYLFGKKRGTGESIWDIKKQLGYVSPELQWYFDTSISCYNAVASGLFDTIGLFRSLNHSQQRAVAHWLQFFDLTNNAQQLLTALPTGKQRLTLLARAMVKNPPVLILDEPCQGLDQQQKDQFIGLTDAICANAGRTLIYVSHYTEDVPSCVSNVLELKNGKASTYKYTQAQHTTK